MSKPKRYTISGLHPHIYENKDGFMVYYEDYTILQAEVERLRKAGDAVVADLEHLTKSRWFDKCKSVNGWNAAKEGKPSV